MDIFVEQLVKKQKTGKDYLRIVACLIGVFAALFAMTFGMAVQGIGFIIFVVCCALIYAMYLLITATNMEYEYCFTNGSLDVDKVINRRSRKRMLSLNTRKIEILATKNNRAFQRNLEDRGLKKVYACTSVRAEDLCFLVYMEENGERKMLLFNPNEKIRDGIRRYNPQKVFLNDENRD